MLITYFHQYFFHFPPRFLHILKNAKWCIFLINENTNYFIHNSNYLQLRDKTAKDL